MTTLVAVTGASGSGKSTLAGELVARRNARTNKQVATLLSLDAYYRDLAHLSFEARDRMNFDHPDAIEFELFEQHLQALRAGEGITAPIYDFSRHTRAEGGTLIEPVDLVVIEGLLLGAWPELTKHVDHLVFVEADLEVCLQRRIERDARERGRSEQSVRDFWNSRVLPMFLEWEPPVRNAAHVVISGEQALEQSLAELEAFLARNEQRG